MVEFTQNQLRQLAKLDWVMDITQPAEADKVKEHLDCVGFASGIYGTSGKLWRGRETGNFYVAYNYSSVIYRF